MLPSQTRQQPEHNLIFRSMNYGASGPTGGTHRCYSSRGDGGVRFGGQTLTISRSQRWSAVWLCHMHKVRYDCLEGLPLGSSWLNGSQLKRTLPRSSMWRHKGRIWGSGEGSFGGFKRSMCRCSIRRLAGKPNSPDYNFKISWKSVEIRCFKYKVSQLILKTVKGKKPFRPIKL